VKSSKSNGIKCIKDIDRKRGLEYALFVSAEVLMKFFLNAIYLCILTAGVFSAVSCGSSGSSTSTGFIVDPTGLSSPSTVYNSTATMTAYSVSFGSSTTRHAIIYQTTTQTGASVGFYSSEGHELAKLSFYANEGSTTKTIPTTVGGSTTFTSSDGGVVVKYASDATNSAKTALKMARSTGTVEFTITLNTAGTYDVTVNKLPDSNITIGTIDNAVKP
jgi:hypothetical protein